MATLEQATDARLAEIRSVIESGVTELTGKSRREYGTEGAFVGRYGGVKPSYPELQRIPDSPKAIAAAIRRGKGKVFERVYRTVANEMVKEGFKPRRSSGRKTISPHEGRSYCVRCREYHTKGQHRFHGPGSFHQTHLFAFNPMTIQQAKKVFAELMQRSRMRPLTDTERAHVRHAGQILRAAKRGKLDRNPRNPRIKSQQFKTLPAGAVFEFVGDQMPRGPWRKVGQRQFALAYGPLKQSYEVKPSAAVVIAQRDLGLSSQGGGLLNPVRRVRRNPNDRTIEKIGRAKEIRYERNVGNSPGYYKHEISSNAGVYTVPGGWFYLSGKSVIISTKPPKGRP